MNKKKYLLFFILLFSLFSCSKKEEDSGESESEFNSAYCLNFVCPTAPPNILSYPVNVIELTVGQTMPKIGPTFIANYFSVVFRTSLSLPSGLVFDKETGEIFGVANSPSEQRTINIIADNRLINAQTGTVIAGGLDIYPLTFIVKDIPPTIPSLVFEDEFLFFSDPNGGGEPPENQGNLILERGDSIRPLVLAFNEGGAITNYEITPSLPVGLSFSNGRITGRPLISQQSRNYQIKISNSGGEAVMNFSITVNGKPPVNLNYISEISSYRAGLDIVQNIPIYEGDTANNFAVEPALPIGLFINTQTGTIFGNPEEIVSNQVYTVTASNDWGSTSSDIIISVTEYVSSIEVGDSFSCAIKNKKVYCWGSNFINQLGYLSDELCFNEDLGTVNCSLYPKNVIINSQELKARKLKLSKASSCSLGFDNKVYCWGDNSFGQLGNIGIPNSLEPITVKDNGTELSDVVEIYSGELFFCAKKINNNLYCWGDNSFGQIKIISEGDKFFEATLVESNVEAVNLGFNNLCISKENNILCRGNNQEKVIENNEIDVLDNFVLMKDFIGNNLTSVGDFFISDTFSFYEKDELWFSKGDNLFGQIFHDELILRRDNFVEVKDSTEILNLEGLSLGKRNWCYLNSGSGYCIGENNQTFSNENLSNFNFVNILIDEILEFSDINMIASKTYNHRCHSNESQIYCYGENNFGQLGNNSEISSIIAVESVFE